MKIQPIKALLFMKEDSERVPNKNLRDFNGRPLFHWILETLSKSKYIEEILKAAGSDSIVLIMGDHGSYISTSLKGYNDLTKDEKSFFVQDRHGVLTALFGASNACEKKLLPYYSLRKQGENISHAKDTLSSDIKGGFTSSARVLSGVVRCLSDQPDKFDKSLNFSNPKNFNDFLYE